MFGWFKNAPVSSITILLSVGIGVVTNLITNEFSWPLVGGLIALILLTLWIDYSEKNKTSDTTQLDKKNREILLKKIAFRSASALPKADEHINLNFAAVEQYLQPAIVELRADRPERDLPKQPIFRIFEENGQKLLVLGEPGSGKTTLLYQLASELSLTAQQDAEKPIPLIINLSSWPKRPAGSGFEDWLLSEMQLSHDIPKEYGQKLLTERQVSFLLDGLDEVAETSREACLDAIDRYFRNLMPVAVCCRTKEYELLRRKLRFEFAVRIKPLAPEQVTASLETLKLTRLSQAYQRHEALREVLSTPLMVRVAATALANEALPEAELSNPDSASKALWRAYARHALHAKKKMEETNHLAGYTEADTWLWLQWLARTLDEKDLTNFFVERMQPDMLPQSKMLLFRILNGLAIGLAIGLAAGLTAGLVGGLAVGLTAGLVGGLAVGLVGGLAELLKSHFIRFLPIKLANGLAVGLAVGLLSGLAFGLAFGLAVGLVLGLAFGLVSSFLAGGQSLLAETIRPVEKSDFHWRPKEFLRSLAFGLVLGLAFGLAFGLADGLTVGFAGDLEKCLMRGLGVGLGVGLAGGLAFGLDNQFSSYSIKDELRAKPNEGIYKSGRFALQFAVLGLIIMLSGFIFQDTSLLQYRLGDSEFKAYFLMYLLGAMMMWWLPESNGGGSYYRHYILRWLLYRAGCIPYRYVRFLDFACRLGFLRRVGGGYTFYHRELRDFIVQEEKMP